MTSRLAFEEANRFNPAMSDQQRWLAHTDMTAPGAHAAALAALPADLPAMIAAIQGVLIHADWAKAYGIHSAVARHTISIAGRLGDIARRDPAPIVISRPPARRSTGSCRDFALMLVSTLRHRAIPSRLRCGFAAYFEAPWEDHWVCEYWHASSRSWRLADAQIDPMLRERQAIAFDAADIPRSLFQTAGEAWRACRSGDDPASFGHGDITGLWFVGVNVIRDHLALNGRETSDWDRWREAPGTERHIPENDFTWLDKIATNPDQSVVAPLEPLWLAK